MKLKSDWLETLSAAARQAPVDLPDPLPRTAARVLAEARAQDAPWWDYLALRGALAACMAAAAVWVLRQEPLPAAADATGLAAAIVSSQVQP